MKSGFVLLGMGALAALAFAAMGGGSSSKPAPGPKPAPPIPPPGVMFWKKTNGQIVPNVKNRVSVPLPPGIDPATLAATLTGPMQVAGGSFDVFPPGTPLPSDWDADDYVRPGMVRAQFTPTVGGSLTVPGSSTWALTF